MIEFESPYYLVLILLIILLIIWYVKFGEQKEASILYSSNFFISQYDIKISSYKSNILLIIKIIIFSLIIVALARPRIVSTLKETTLEKMFLGRFPIK